MPLSVGTRLGPYEITGPLGAGGMGEVYRARDSRLNRDVAIKTLPSAFAADSNRMARFQREAQVLAALSHPNIGAIYGIEEGALVMELVEGATLAERIGAPVHGSGPIPLEEALTLARQIADALEAAHEKGIIHRDLKPANIKVTPDGKVKVLDFGLAKAFESDPISGDLTNSPTLTLDSTRAGVILGTAGYMSPEQARGKPADKRSDIWAFGVVLFEMLTGRTTFEGETVSDTLAAVLKSDPEWRRLPAATPPKVRRLLQRCLERDPKKRLRDIGDAWIEIDAPDEPASAASAKQPHPGSRWLPWIAAALVAAAGVAWGLLHTPPVAPRTVTRWAATQKDPFAFLALSRDGTRLAYAEAAGGAPHLALRMMDQLEGKTIPGSDGGLFPVFSPDAQWIAYSAPGRKLKKIPVTGGTSITLCDGGADFGASWGDDDTIIFTGPKGLLRVAAAGGTPQALTTVDSKKGETAHGYPHFLPGGQAVLFTVGAGTGSPYEASKIAVFDLKKGSYRVLANGSDGRYVPTGHLVYIRGGTLFGVPFDVKRMVVTGSESPVVEGVSSTGPPGSGQYSFSETGLLVYLVGGQQQGTTLAWADRKGAAQPLGSAPRLWGTGRLSPDGLRVANGIEKSAGGERDVWIYELERGTLTRLTFEGTNDNPVWTPEGKRVAFSSTRAGKNGIYWVAADGSGKAEQLLAAEHGVTPSSWTPDGKALLYTQSGSDQQSHIFVLPVPGNGSPGQPRAIHDATLSEYDGMVSPDGRWLAYGSLESGTQEIYVQPFPGPGGKIRISTQGGNRPRWSRNGRELFYWELGGTSRLMTVDIQTAPVFRASSPQPLFLLPVGTTWDVAPDAKRFLVELTQGAGGFSKMEAVTDWFEELRRIAPAKK